MISRKIVQGEYKEPVLAAINAGAAYLGGTEDTQRCPFADYFTANRLHDPQSYIEQTPSIGPRLGFQEGEAPEVSPHAYHLGKLLGAAYEDTIKLYDAAHRYLATYENISDAEALQVIRNSRKFGRHYASLEPGDGAYLMFAVSKDHRNGFQCGRHDSGRISMVDFSRNLIRSIIRPRQRNGIGCSALNILVYPPEGGLQRRPQGLFDLYWDAMVVRAYKRHISLPSYQKRK